MRFVSIIVFHESSVMFSSAAKTTTPWLASRMSIFLNSRRVWFTTACTRAVSRGIDVQAERTDTATRCELDRLGQLSLGRHGITDHWHVGRDVVDHDVGALGRLAQARANCPARGRRR